MDPDSGRLQKESIFSNWNVTMCQGESVHGGCRICNASRSGPPLTRVPGINPIGTGHLPGRRELDFTMSQTRYYMDDPDDPDYLKRNFAQALEGLVNENGSFVGRNTTHGEVSVIVVSTFVTCFDKYSKWCLGLVLPNNSNAAFFPRFSTFSWARWVGPR